MLSKGSSIAVRASAALPAAGVYDAAPTAIKIGDAKRLELFTTYTRAAGQAGGAFKFKLLVSIDGVTFFERTVEDVAAGSGVTLVYTAQHEFPAAAGDPAETRAYPPIDVSTTPYIALPCAEYGNTAHPGTLVVSGVLAT